MIKLVATTSNGLLVMLGVTARNITKLTAGEPLVTGLAELGLGDGKLVISYGEDFHTLIKDWRAAGLPVPQMPEPQPGQTFRRMFRDDH